MLGQKRRERAVGSARAVKVRAERLSEDGKFRREVAAAFEHAGRALQRAERVGGRRGHKLRNTVLLVAGAGAAAAASDKVRKAVAPTVESVRGSAAAASVVQESLALEVPVSTAYNRWTQFEQFPQFMDGVEEVRQLDDTRLHWVASVGGRRAEWDAKILEQHPDRQISWASEAGRKTRGSISFEPLDQQRTLLTLSMSYQLESIRERVGSALGADRRRIRGDLQRFKQLIESQAASESDGWRGTISNGDTGTAQTTTPPPSSARSATGD